MKTATRLLLAVALVLGALAGPASAAKVNALVLQCGGEKVCPPIADYLGEAGIELVYRSMKEPVSAQTLRLFHLVVLMDFEGLQTPWFHGGGFLQEYYTLKQNVEVLQQWVQGGGGLFMVGSVGTGGLITLQALEPLLGKWGVGLLPANARDDAHAWTTYAWTENVIAHPATAGVKRLFYPTQMGRWDDIYPCLPVELRDPRWKPLVRGMAGSKAQQALQYTTWFDYPGASNPPVLAAVAEIGKGRVAILSVHRYYLLTNAYDDVAQGWMGEFATGNIAGVVAEKGDGKLPSDGKRLLRNMLVWAAESAPKAGLGGYTAAAYAAVPKVEPPPVPAWVQPGWPAPEVPFHKVLVGARSVYSSGKGTVAEWAAAAKQAGYGILVMTEDLGAAAGDKWPAYYAACQSLSGPDFQVLPGLQVPDAYGNQILIFGQSAFPRKWMLTPDGKAMKELQFLMLGMGKCHTVLARPSASPLPDHLFKFFSGVAVATYDAEGKLIDNGLQTWQRQNYNLSSPLPLAVHELFAPDQVAKAAESGMQLYVPADTAESAAWYLRDGMAHFWEGPAKFMVTSGPVVRGLSGGSLKLESGAPLTDVRYLAQYEVVRRWKPNAASFEVAFSPPAANLHLGWFWAQDEAGGTLVTAPVRWGNGGGYNYRCSDRQNFFSTALGYTGTILSQGMDIYLPTFGTLEGSGLWPRQSGPERGENMAPLLEFPFLSPVATVTDVYLDQRYWKALWEEVVFDAKAPQGTSRSRVYQGRVRYYDLHQPVAEESKRANAMMLIEVELALRQPVYPSGDVFPAFAYAGSPQPECVSQDANGQWVKQKLTQGYLDLPVGGQAGDIVALSPGLRVNAQGRVGFTPTAAGVILPVGYAWQASFVRLDAKLEAAEARRAMGLEGAAPYALKLTRGKLESLAYVANLSAAAGGVAGEVAPYAQAKWPLTLRVAGLNPNWPAGVWQPAAAPEPVACGVFEGNGWGRLDLTKGGAFYAGNLVTAGDPALRLGLLAWDKNGIALELNNAGDAPLETTVSTPAEITGLFRLEAGKVKLAPGEMVRLRWPGGNPM